MKVLIIYNKIWSYREPIFDLINEEFDLTVSYSDKKFINKVYNFKTIYLPVTKIGPFEFHNDDLHKICNKYDVVIGISNIRWLSLVLLCFKKKRKYKIGYWGIGVTASYENKFDSKSTWDKIRFYVSKKSDFTLFYSSYPLKRYINAGISKNKLFIANNTTQVYDVKNVDYDKKENFLFLGTLYKEKGINELLEAYKKLNELNSGVPKLLIVGDGPEKNSILEFIKNNNLISKVILYGSVYEPKRLAEIFSLSLACISPNQAGLSVLNSMGNHTCFITSEGAITGGEIFNIKNEYNGIIYGRDLSLLDCLQWLLSNKDKVKEMNINAYEYYINYRTPTMMANEIKKAIAYSLNN